MSLYDFKLTIVYRFLNDEEGFKEQARKNVEDSHSCVTDFGGDESEIHEIR